MIEFKELPVLTKRSLLHVFFSGKQGDYSTNHFHFQGKDYDAGYSRLFVRDTTNQWYNTEDYSNAVLRIRERCSMFEDVIFIGSSMGGYGALKFALDFRPRKVLAFSPQVETPFGPDLSYLYSNVMERPEIEIHLCRTSKNKNWDDLGAAQKCPSVLKL